VDYQQGFGWYAQRSAAAAFARAVREIGEDPIRFPACDEPGFRYASLERYPFSVIFRVGESAVHVIAVAHAKRKPGYWTSRT
jgi:plasmid stabilization system protein ParE